MRHLTQNMPKLPHPLAISYLPADYLLVINASNTFTCNFFPHYMLGNRLKPTSQWTILKLVLQIASRSMPPDHRSPVHIYCLHHLFRSPYHLIHHITPGNTALFTAYQPSSILTSLGSILPCFTRIICPPLPIARYSFIQLSELVQYL